jgi:hypothetical protein
MEGANDEGNAGREDGWEAPRRDNDSSRSGCVGICSASRRARALKGCHPALIRSQHVTSSICFQPVHSGIFSCRGVANGAPMERHQCLTDCPTHMLVRFPFSLTLTVWQISLIVCHHTLLQLNTIAHLHHALLSHTTPACSAAVLFILFHCHSCYQIPV